MKTLLLVALALAGCSVDVHGFGGGFGDAAVGGASGIVRGVGGASGAGDVAGTGGIVSTGGVSGTGGELVGSGGGVVASGGAGGDTVVPGTGGSGTGGSGTGGTDPTTGNVKVQFTCSSSPDKRTAIQVWRVVTTTHVAIPMSEWDLVYWYTANDHLPAQPTCDLYNGERCASGEVAISTLTRTINRPEADSYINVHFSAAGLPAPNTYVAHLQTSFHYFDFAPIDFSDDYSCDLSSADISTWEKSEASVKDWMKVGLYRNGTLVWGVEP